MIESVDGEAKFKADSWTREDGGGGLSMVLSNGSIFEKAGVNLAVVYGVMPQEALKAATKSKFDRSG
jgi:coproporphyrinogen III oxidase